MNRIKALCLAAAAGTVALSGQAAMAETIIVTFMGAAPAGPLTAFTYNVQLAAFPPASAAVGTGVAYDHFTLFDFAGYDSHDLSLAPGWAFDGAPLTGPAAFSQSPTDSGGVENPTFEWTGGLVTSPSALGTVVVYSTYSNTRQGVYSSENAEDPDGVGPLGYAPSGHTASTTVAAVPLPAAAWAGMALMGAIGTNSLRKRRKEALC